MWNFLKWYSLFILIILIFGPILYEWRYEKGVGELGIFYKNMIGFITLIFIPNLILIIQYYKENKNTKLTIDQKNGIIEINHKGTLNSYRIEEIESSIYQRNTYSKDLMWQVFSYSNLGYCDLTLKNGDRYFLTSYLIDITKKALFENTEIKYSIFPSIDKTDPKIIAERAKKQTKKQIEKLKSNLINKSKFELKGIVDNDGVYTKETVDIAKQILKEKNVV